MRAGSHHSHQTQHWAAVGPGSEGSCPCSCVWEQGRLSPVPASRKEVFEHGMPVGDKRALWRFLKGTSQALEGQGSLQVRGGCKVHCLAGPRDQVHADAWPSSCSPREVGRGVSGALVMPACVSVASCGAQGSSSRTVVQFVRDQRWSQCRPAGWGPWCNTANCMTGAGGPACCHLVHVTWRML